MTQIGETELAGSLADYCADTLSFSMHLRRSENPGEINAVRQRMGEMLTAMTNRAKASGVAQENSTLAGYALVALLDEIVLTSNWPIKEGWMSRPLQMQYFNSFSAGEDFYNKLQSVRGVADPGKQDVLEVYYLCLCLGFKGKYGNVQGMETLQNLLNELSTELSSKQDAGGKAPAPGARRREVTGGLSPRWRAPDGGGKASREFPVRVVVVLSLFFLLFVYVVLLAILRASAVWALDPLG